MFKNKILSRKKKYAYLYIESGVPILLFIVVKCFNLLLFCRWDFWYTIKMPINEPTSSGKNKLGLTLPEVPKDPSDQNHSENGYKIKIKSYLFCFFFGSVF